MSNSPSPFFMTQRTQSSLLFSLQNITTWADKSTNTSKKGKLQTGAAGEGGILCVKKKRKKIIFSLR